MKREKTIIQPVHHVKVILFFLKRHFRAYAGLALLGILVGVLEAFNLAVFMPILGKLIGAIPGNVPGEEGSFLLGAVDRIIRFMPISDPFLSATTLFVILTFLKGGLALLHEYFSARVASDVLHGYRCSLMEYYKSAPLSLFQETSSGSLIYNLSTPPIMLSKLLYSIPRFFVDSLRFFFVLVLLFYVEPGITMGLIAFGIIAYFLFSKGLSGFSYNLAAERRREEQEMAGLANEWIGGLRSIRAADADKHWIEGYGKSSARAAHVYRVACVIMASPRHLFEIAAFSLLLGGMMLAYHLEPTAFQARLASVGLFAMGMVRVLPSIAAMARAPLEARSALPDVEYLYDVLRKSAQPIKQGDVRFNGLRDAIRIDSATVEYPGRGRVMDAVSIVIPKGKAVAVVGSSGAGKTTFLNILLGAQPLTAGAVYYDDVNLRDIQAGSLLRRIGYVGQEVALFRGTIRDNISFFRSDIPLEKIKQVAELAEIKSFIEALPDGYETIVGEGGANFSGGQAQRLAIARALVNDPDMLILDEATSALDSSSEKAVVHSLQRAARNRTVIMVTHKLSSVRWADSIVVLDGGKVAESGAWDRLLTNTDGHFARMCREQHLA